MNINPALVFIILIAALVGAIYYDARWQERHPDERGSVWGYFQALVFFPIAIICLSLPFTSEEADFLVWIYFAVYGLFAPFASYHLLKKKKKWAWIAVVVLQMNIINWIIDHYYEKKRWHEFK